MRHSSVFMIAISSALLASSFAAAQEETTVVHVNYADLNLANATGVSVLRHRVARAVDEVCGKPEFIGDLRGDAATRKCRSAAEAGAEAQTLKVIATARSGASPFALVLASR